MYWSQAATDPWFNAIDESYGNGLRVVSGFSPITGLIDYRQSGTGGSTTNVQNLGYTWDKAQNLTQRQDSRQGLTEAFYYDALNRLDYSTLNGTTNLDVTLDLIGNVTYRSDVGSYTYHATRKHAVTAAGGNTYTYDANGNVATRNGVAIVWASYNLPLTINGSGQAAQLAYAPDRSRWRQISSYAGGSETTIYVGEALEKMTASASNIVRWRHLIPTPGANVQVTRRSDGTNEVLYVAKDHLGSTDALLNASGTVLARASFASYGGRRGSAWSGAPTTAEMQAYADQTRRGYTEHEMLDNVGLIHMNGRVYDPGVGRFMSADPIADGLGEAGGFNRYAYVQNSPLSWVDPEGWESQCLVANCKPRSDPPAGTRINLPGYTSASNTSCIGNCGGASGYLRRTYVTEQSQVGDHVTVTGRTQLTWVSYNYSPMIADFLKGYSGSTSVFDERTAAVEAGEFARGVIDAGAAVIGAGLIIADLANTAWPGLQGPDVGVVGLGMIMARSGAARTVGHHTIPKAIQKQLPPSVRNHPDVVGRAGNPNVRQIPEASHRRIHSSPPGNYYPGGDYNHRFDQLIRERGGYDAVSPRDVNQNRDQLVREFGL